MKRFLIRSGVYFVLLLVAVIAIVAIVSAASGAQAPVKVLWPGFIVTALFWGLMLWLAWCVVVALVFRMRSQAGHRVE